jgi:anti-sigma-K factor RskA
MDSPERLAGDQRAVLQLVLGQGRSYGEIAETLSIAPDEVRARAHAALDALGPPTTLSDADRARIADYLLGQLPASDEQPVRDALADSPQQQAWARVVSTELEPLASSPLPPIPDRAAPRSSRTGGIVLLSVLAAAIIAVVVIFVIKPGGGSSASGDPNATVAQATPGHSSTSSTSSISSSQTTSSSQTAAIVGQINLTPPTGGGKTKGVALVLRQGSLRGLGIEAEHVPPASAKQRTTYAVWLYNSPSDATRLGYFSKGVNKKGALGSTAELPVNAAHYKYLIITVEPGDKTSKTPGAVLLQGNLSDIAKSKL